MSLSPINSISFSQVAWDAGKIGPSRYSDMEDQDGKDKGKVRDSSNLTDPDKNQRAVGQSNKDKLTEEERQQVEKLKQREQEVIAHEQAHIAAGGSYVRGDGKFYIVGGEVSIDASPVPNNPSATIQKMETVIRAALAPAQPSGQDYQVAARAQMELTKAQMELLEKRGKETYSGFNTTRLQQASDYTAISLIA
jgi:hypothetical protein